MLITGNKTGALTFTLDDPRVDLKSVTTVPKGVLVSIKTPERVRRNDKLYKMVPSGKK
jgi:U32 family peptidase